MDNVQDGVAELREAVDRDAQRYERATQRVTSVTGQDASGTVALKLDAQGRFQSVTVTESWRTSVGPEALGAAVVEAYAAAGAERTRTWGEAVAEVAEEPAPATRPAPPSFESLAGQLADLRDATRYLPSSAATEEALLEAVQELRRGMHQAFAEVDARAGSSITGHSGAGNVSAVLTGLGDLQEVVVDPRWATATHAFNISREITEAVVDAGRRIPSDPGALLEGTALARIQQLTSDAAALTDFVRAHERG